MNARPRRGETAEREGLIAGVVAILITGAVLGMVFNYVGLNSRRSWGLSWIAVDKVEQLVAMEPVTTGGVAVESGYSTAVNDPLAAPIATAIPAGLPPIPDVGRPVQIELAHLKQYFDASAAVLVDAREAEEYVEGHIPGAIHLPYDDVVTDPARLEALETGGRPVVTYCGGGSCEVSVSMAEELLFAGHAPVAVYTGGFPEWVEAGYPIQTGSERGGAATP